MFLKTFFNEEIISFQNIDTQLNSLITSKYNMSPGGSNTHTHTHKTILNSNTKKNKKNQTHTIIVLLHTNECCEIFSVSELVISNGVKLQ